VTATNFGAWGNALVLAEVRWTTDPAWCRPDLPPRCVRLGERTMRNFALTFLLAFSGCGLYENCECVNQQCTAIDCSSSGDEVGGGSCGIVVFQDGSAVLSHDSCSTAVQQALDLTGEVPFAYSITPEECGPLPDEPKRWPCFNELELLAQPATDPLMCGFCPNFTGTSAAPSICWIHPSGWLPATLQAAVTQTDCGEIQPPLGVPDGYTLPMPAPAGWSCLGSSTRCSPKCRDEAGEDIGFTYESDFIDPWWSPYVLPDVPPLVDGEGYPVEATCTGEPLVWRNTWTSNGWVGRWVGSTIELDGYDPPYPPNGELHHTPVWDLADTEMETDPASGNVVVSSELAAAAVALPNEPTLHGRAPALSVVACSAGSICDQAGLAVGDRLLGLHAEGTGLYAIDIVDEAGAERSLYVEIGEP
jgi:hypothetical protein